jgi:CubicO group peptidase (beta-lactamase class C family)
MSALSKTIAVTICWALGSLKTAAADRLLDDLARIRAGGGGIEVAGIVVATVNLRGRMQSAAAGCARFDRDGRLCVQPLRVDGIMRIASISKLATAAAVQDAVDRGTLRWDRDVGESLGFRLTNPSFPDTPITLRQLANHTSSIIDGDPFWRPWQESIDASMSSTHTFDAAHAPGSFFRYSNFNYVLLGQILERNTGLRFDRLMQSRILRPAGIVAGYNWSTRRPVDPARVVTLYRRQSLQGLWEANGPWIAQLDDFAGGAPPSLDDRASYRIGSNGSAFSPHGGLRISIPDLARWFSGLDPQTFRRLRSSPFIVDAQNPNGDSECGFYRDFAQGLHSFDMPGVGRVWGHFGEAYGLRAGLLRDPDSRRVWAYAITGYGDDPDRTTACAGGLDTVQQAVLQLLAAQGDKIS